MSPIVAKSLHELLTEKLKEYKDYLCCCEEVSTCDKPLGISNLSKVSYKKYKTNVTSFKG
jgi:hypothetical protein